MQIQRAFDDRSKAEQNTREKFFLMFRKLIWLLSEETSGFDPRWQLAKLLMLPIPRYNGGRMRAYILRQLGFQVGRGTMIWDTPLLIGGKNLHTNIRIGDFCLISVGSYWDLAAPIRLGNFVGVSPETMLLTGTHRIHNPKNRVGGLEARPVIICDGVWLGARCIVLPGVTVSEGAVVGAGAIVTKDVPAHTMVAGVPAKFIRELPQDV